LEVAQWEDPQVKTDLGKNHHQGRHVHFGGEICKGYMEDLEVSPAVFYLEVVWNLAQL
jgi:hypothetical protein